MSAAKETDKRWIKHAAPPFDQHCANLFMLNNKELLVVPKALHGKVNALWIYDIDDDKYTNICAKNTFNQLTEIVNQYYTTSLSDDKSVLYLFGESGYVIQVNLKTKHCTTSIRKFHDGSHSRSLFINGQFHIFGGWKDESNSHYIWDESKQTLIEAYKFEEMNTSLNCHSVSYLKSKNSVLIIAGRVGQISYLYSLLTNQCQILQHDPHRHSPLSALTRAEDYIITCFNFGVWNEIHVLNLKTMNTAVCQNVEAPADISGGQLIVVSNVHKEELLTFGYIRSCWNLLEFSSLRYPPFYIVEIIDSYYAQETLHLIDSVAHWTIDIDHIVG